MQAIIPATVRDSVRMAVRARACDKRGRVFSATDRVAPSALRSRLVLDVRAADESVVHRVCALVLLQVGGRAIFSRTRHDAFGRYLVEPEIVGTVVLPPSVEVVI